MPRKPPPVCPRRKADCAEALTARRRARTGVEAGVMDLDAELTMLDAER